MIKLPTAKTYSDCSIVSASYAILNWINFTNTPPAWHEWEVVHTKYAVSGSSWANYDILNEDGSIYLSASDPIPIYE